VDEASAISLYAALEAAGAPVWLMGGWGVDALLSRQTREHHDLDVLVDVGNLERLRLCLIEVGFALAYTWDDEVWWVTDQEWSSPLEQPTAFVYRHDDGREVDVHAIRADATGTVQMLWNVPYMFTAEGLAGIGHVGRRPVRCLTREMQLAAHTGYTLPPHHLQDVRLLRERWES
jgi:lincosamide nucleotidyltransferase A/C/D/E